MSFAKANAAVIRAISEQTGIPEIEIDARWKLQPNPPDGLGIRNEARLDAVLQNVNQLLRTEHQVDAELDMEDAVAMITKTVADLVAHVAAHIDALRGRDGAER